MESSLECGVCFSIFNNVEHRPKSLPCGHTLCASCITDTLNSNEGNMNCPFCRTSCGSGVKTLDDFPTTFALLNLIDNVEPTVPSKILSPREKEKQSLQEKKQSEYECTGSHISNCNKHLQRLIHAKETKKTAIPRIRLEKEKILKNYQKEEKRLEEEEKEAIMEENQLDDIVAEGNDIVKGLEALQDRIRSSSSLLGLNMASQDVQRYYTASQEWETSRVKNILKEDAHVTEETTHNANEEQILLRATACLDRPEDVQKALNELYNILKVDTCHNQIRVLNVILLSMTKHRHNKYIHVAGSASLFHIVKSDSKSNLCERAKQKIIEVLLTSMENHLANSTLVRNCCFTLCQFRIPEDVLFTFKRLAQIVLSLIQSNPDNKNKAIYILGRLAPVYGEKKDLLGDLGAIETMLKLTNDRIKSHLYDDLLLKAWSVMWSLTDASVGNCQAFVNGNGLNYFQKCLQEFPDKPQLLLNMMGALVNISEVESQRKQFMKPELLNILLSLLDSIKVSYVTASILSYLASSGPQIWTVKQPSRGLVLMKLAAAIEKWDLTAKGNVNYSSFEPFMNLLELFSTPECQHFAVWALANLTKVSPDRYCTLVEMEGILVMLEKILESSVPYARIKTLAQLVITQCQLYKECGSLEIMD